MFVIMLFWTSLFLIVFSYFGYPLSLKLVLPLVKKKLLRKPFTPPVSLIITAFNEESRIQEKLDNTLKIDYPKSALQIIVTSDGSTDRTNCIVDKYSIHGIELLALNDHLGKENAQSEAVKLATGEIFVFSDAATLIDSHSIKEIISNFADPSIGCVSSVDRIIYDDNTKTGGEGFYVKYEMWLRNLESSVNSIVGLSGSFFAARREICTDFSPKMQSDFRTLLNCIKSGMRGISDSNAIGYYKDIKNRSREFERKVRTVLRGLTVFFNHLEFLNFLKYGIFSYQYFSHKLIRWLVPLFLITTFISSLFLMKLSTLYGSFFFLQMSFYLSALAGLNFPKLTEHTFIRIPAFFVIVNTSIIIAWIKYFQGKRIITWQPSIR
jgi:glycosyltransferase involved in cell wall biosynthesis